MMIAVSKSIEITVNTTKENRKPNAHNEMLAKDRYVA